MYQHYTICSKGCTGIRCISTFASHPKLWYTLWNIRSQLHLLVLCLTQPQIRGDLFQFRKRLELLRVMWTGL